MTDVKGKTVLITGAASGIGYCLAEEFAKAGSTLVISDINHDGLEQAAERLRRHGGPVHAFRVDIAKQAMVETMIAKVQATIGQVDILVNNAGIGHNGEIVETDLKTWKKLMDVNFWGPLYHIYAILPAMVQRQNGHIVNVSSGQAFFRLPTWSVYATVKLALGAFSEMLHFEVSKFGIRVTTVYPFMVNTPFYRHIEGDTYFGKLSMKLVPYYSNSPETVAHKIFQAVRRDDRVEMVNILNHLGFFTQAIPPLATTVAWVTNYFLGKSKENVVLANN